MPLQRPVRPSGRTVRRAAVGTGALLAGSAGGWLAGLLRVSHAPPQDVRRADRSDRAER